MTMNDTDVTQPSDENQPQAGKRKILVDEDWKSQVQAEKEALRQGQSTTQTTAGQKKPDEAEKELPFPEASFAVLITTLATQTTVALGQLGLPDNQQPQVDLNLAKHLIDTLDILQQKTRGNLTAEEANLLTNYLYQLRMLFVTVQSEKQKSPPSPLKPS